MPRTTADFQPTGLLLDPPDPHLRDLAPAWVAAFILASAVLVAIALWYQRMESLRAGERLTHSVVHVLAEQTTRSIQTVEERLRLAVADLDEMDRTGRLGEATGRERLRSLLHGTPFVRAMWVLDTRGRIVLDSDTGNIGLDLSDRDYFQVHRREAASDGERGGSFFIGPLVRSRTNGQWLISASMSVPGHRWGAVIVAAIEPPYFQSVWRELEVGQDGLIALFHRNGQLMIRTPEQEGAIGRNFLGTTLFRERLPQAEEGVYIARSQVDGVERVFGYHVLPEYPQFLAVVGMPVSLVLAPWRRFALLSGALWLVGVGAASALALQLRRQQRRRRHVEQRFADLAQAMPQIVFTCDGQGTVEYVNRRWVEETGRPAQLAVGVPWYDWAAHEAPQLRDEVRQRIEDGEPVEVELQLPHVDGSACWYLVRVMPNRDEQGELRSWYGTATDVNALKLAQAQLQTQKDILHIGGRLAGLAGWSYDVATARLTWSDDVATMLDFLPGSEPQLEDLLARMPPEDRQRVIDARDGSLRTGGRYDVEVRMTTPAGREVWLRSIGEAVRDAQGRVVRFDGAMQDITQRVNMLAEIRELNATLEQRIADRTRELAQQEALFRTLTEQAPQPIWTVDPDGKLLFISRAWYELVGGTPQQWLGEGWMKLIHPADMEAVRRNWLEARSTGAPYEGTRRVRGRDGRLHTMSYRAKPVTGPDGEVSFWVGMDVDITDLVAQEEALRAVNEQLRSFSYSVSHDLQSPLQRIGSFAQLLERELGELPADSRAAHFLRRIRANADEMTQLVQGLLALSHVTQAEVVRGRVDLSALATEILEGLQASHPGRRVEWSVQPGLAAEADVRLLRSILDNLLGNAWKFTAGGERPRIEVGGEPARGEFFVRDNGVGFDMAHADNLFGAFQRLHRQDEFPGTGIGLATVARAVARLGGQVWAQARPGEGATFFFTLPLPRA